MGVDEKLQIILQRKSAERKFIMKKIVNVNLYDGDNSEQIKSIKLICNDWNIEELTGYRPITTFYMDFSLAEPFGLDSVKDTYNRAFEEWKYQYTFLTELVMALNWKMWEHYNHNDKLAHLYNDLWKAADKYAVEHLQGDELSYFLHSTD